MNRETWSGSFARLSFPDVLAELNREQAEGMLYCVRDSFARGVRFESGLPRWVTPTHPDEGLAPFLFRRGLISHKALSDAHADPGMGIDPVERQLLAAEHAYDLLLDLFAWEEGAFVFTGGRVEGNAPRHASFPASMVTILARGLPRVSRIDAVKAGAGTADTRLEANPDLNLGHLRELSEETCAVLGAIRTADLDEAGADRSWPSDFLVLQSVWELRLLELVRTCPVGRGVAVGDLLLGRQHRQVGGTPAAAPPAVAEAPAAATPSFPAANPPAPTHNTNPAIRPEPPAMPPSGANRSPQASATSPSKVPPPAMPSSGGHGAPAQRADAPSSPYRSPSLAASAPSGPIIAPKPLGQVPPPAEPPLRVRAVPLPKREHPGSPQVTGLSQEDLRSSSAVRTREATALDWFKNGERFLREHDMFNAVTSFREAVRFMPENPDYQIRLGTTLAKNPKWRKESEECLLAAIELQPWEAKGHIALAKLYADAGLFKRAEARYRAALDADPVNPLARKELADLSKKQSSAKAGGSAVGQAANLLGKLRRVKDEGELSAPAGDLLEEGAVEV